MNNQPELRRRAREAIANGKLPARLPVRTWAGKGGGASCIVCSFPVNTHEVEFELEFETTTFSCTPGTSRVHVHCFEAWQSEATLEAGTTFD